MAYPRELKEHVRNLIKDGLSKAEAARRANVCYRTVISWTLDIRCPPENKINIGGSTVKLLAKLVSNGYAFYDGHARTKWSYRTLQKYFPVKRAELHRVIIYYLEGREKKAMEALLERLNIRSISYQKLGFIRRTFGVKKY